MENANERRKLEETKQELTYQTSYDSLQFSGEYAGRIKVLRALGYIDKQNMVSVKGKLACEISNQVSEGEL
jgi:antiviral helicase SKI2